MNPGILSLVQFMNNSTAGNATITHQGSDYYVYAAATLFRNTSSAGNGYFIAEGALPSHQQLDGNPGSVAFFDTTTAGNGTFIANGGQAAQTAGGVIDLEDSSTAENGTFYANGATIRGAFGGRAEFRDDSQASAATLIATASSGDTEDSGGGILFFDTSTGDTARVELVGNGFLDLREHDTPKLTIGSLSGDGLVFLGAANLSVGSNNLSTKFSGLIEENSEGTSGSLTKIGTGSLKLSGANTYTGGTIVEQGKLVVGNSTGSATGTGPVQVNGGTFGGKGIVSGNLTVGAGSGGGAILAPGAAGSTPTVLTIQSNLTFKADAIYLFKLNAKKARTDMVMANGATIEAGAQFEINAVGNKKLTTGKVFTAIGNTAATPISGTFANLADGSTVAFGVNKLQVSYSGGDGNDLTLTVVP
jgi:autotransporter-associated beta strand protein